MPTAKNFLGAASATTLSSGISAGTTTFDVANASSYPTANFNIVIDRGLAGEEKIFISSRSGNTFTVGTRGDDGTSAAAHSTDAVVEHCLFAEDQQENNDHINDSTGVHGIGASSSVVGTTDTQTLANKTLTSPTMTAPTVSSGVFTLPGSGALDFVGASTGRVSSDGSGTVYIGGTVNQSFVKSDGVIVTTKGLRVGADDAAHDAMSAWVSYTPTFANMTGATGVFKYKIIGKTLTLSYDFTGGTATATAVTYFSLPAGLTSATGRRQGSYDTNFAVSGPYVQANDTVVYLGNGETVASGTSLSVGGYGFLVLEVQ